MHSPSCSPQILQLLSRKVDRDVIDYLMSTTIETVDFALGLPTSIPRPPTRRPFLQLTLAVIQKSRINSSVVLVTLVYLERARTRLRICDQRWAYERMLIGALVLATKYVSDYTIKNAQWAEWSGVFSNADVSRMERELLHVLDWNLSIAEGDVMAHHEHLSPLIPPRPLPPVSRKRPRSHFQGDANLGLEPSPFCPPPPLPGNPTVLASRTRALTTSVTLPGFSSFLHNFHRHPPVPSLQPSFPSLLPMPVTSGEERPHKRPRLVPHPLGPRQPLGLENNRRHPVSKPLQRSIDPRIFNSLGLSSAWPKSFDPFIFSYIPPMSFYEP